MTEFTIIPDPDAGLPWGGYDFEKTSLAVIAANASGNGSVLWTVGPHVNLELQEAGLTRIDDLGLEPPSEGIWIWEGRYIHTRSFDGEYESHPKGEFRRPNDAEWAAIRESTCPWDDSEWLLCFCEREGVPCLKHEADPPAPKSDVREGDIYADDAGHDEMGKPL